MSEISKIIEKQHPGKLFLRLKEACDLCGLSVGNVYNRRSRGLELPFKVKMMGGKPMVPVSELMRIAE